MKKFLGLQGLQEVIDKIKAMISSLNTIIDSHISNTSNPHKITKDQIGLNNVENKSSLTIRSEITKQNVIDGLGYTPIETQYEHPLSHPASIITQDETHRFVSDTEKSSWNSKANGKHTHTSADITSLEASKITGTINIENLPQGSLERCVLVQNDTERFSLTTDTVQKGDTVKVVSSGKMYFVIDDTKLSTEDGYEVYTSGSATSVPWSGVTGKPNTFPPATHNHTKADVGLGNVENKSSATIRSELTKENVTTALGYTPPTQDTKYTHPSYTAKTNGLYKVTVDSTGHVSEVASVTKSDITALGIPGQDTNTTYSVATQSTNGLLSSTDKTKLDGIATGANKYVLPTASSSTLGGVKTTSSVTSASGYTACPIISGVPYYKDTNTTYSLGSFGITATAAELNYTDGVTSNIQTQLNGKAASSHTHSQYAASSHTHTKAQISDFPSSLPANGGTATNANNVVQTAVDASGYTNWRTLVWGASNSGTEGFTPATVTGGVYTCKTITCQPSSGTIKANVFKGSLSGNASSASSVPWSGVSGKPSSMPASDVYTWAKASSKPSYSWSEIGSKPSTFTPSSHTHTLSQVSGVTPSAIGAAPASHSHSYLPLSGGTLTGRLNAPTVGGSWVSGMTLTNATLGISTKNSSGSYHPIIACKTYNSHVWNLGTITDTVGFYGFKNGRTENATDWSFAINVISGAVTSSGSITAPTFYGNLSGNASSASSVAWGNVSGKPTTFTPAAHNQAWSTITGKPSTFAPSAHSHAVAQSSEPSGQNNGDLWFKSI